MARPSKLDQIARTRDDGTTVTVGDDYIERVRLGLPHDQAAASAGIARQTVIRWRAWGAAARAKKGRLTKNEQLYVTFCDNLERAEAEAEMTRLGVIERAARGGVQVTEVHRTEKIGADGQLIVVEQRTVTKTLRPEWTAAAWWLERRLPQRYSRRVEMTGPEGGPIPVEDRARDLAAGLRDFLAGAEAGKALERDAEDRQV